MHERLLYEMLAQLYMKPSKELSSQLIESGLGFTEHREGAMRSIAAAYQPDPVFDIEDVDNSFVGYHG
jgi:hypothetical protein